MRSRPTDAEQRLWSLLRAHRFSGYKFKRQLPIGHHMVDFACLAARLIVETDGGQHGHKADVRRNAYLKAQGFRILRFWNNDILANEEGVAECILDALHTLSPTPLPQGERGYAGAPHA